ncbi:hypothetical protein X769_31775 [Mesorhizobium sp. LSJC268A00]|uniref:hypothetical protein n=1 Tax=unclassified Mesorhizobium TaxID=325217 RepID=UPI0003CF798E|nr:hypothetical protein [Mesorhizobium sp. LSJC268A00]ESW94777.1 hypothetical protein X769_31775 [Mesorhizobium sp. LSJC268A00]
MIELNAAGKMDKEIAAALNVEGFVAARGCAFKGENVWLLRTRWAIPTIKINGTSANPDRWPDEPDQIEAEVEQYSTGHDFYRIAAVLIVGALTQGRPATLISPPL